MWPRTRGSILNIIKLAAACAVAAVVASPAYAGDFSGPYVGAGVTLDNVQGTGALDGIGFSGVGGTAFAGYNMTLGNSFFAGVEANADVYSADAFGIKAKWGWGVGGRLGVKVNPSTALYARAGYARAKLSAGGFSDWGDGVRYGLGVETGVGETVAVRAEFTQTNYEGDLANNQGALSLVVGF